MTQAMPDVADLDELVFDASYAGPLRIRYWRDDGLRIATSDGKHLNQKQCTCGGEPEEFYWRKWRIETLELSPIDEHGFGCLHCRREIQWKTRLWSMDPWL